MGENRGVMEGTLGKVAVGIMKNMTVLVRLFGSEETDRQHRENSRGIFEKVG